MITGLAKLLCALESIEIRRNINAIIKIIITNIHFQSLEVVCRGSETQLQVPVNLNSMAQ